MFVFIWVQHQEVQPSELVDQVVQVLSVIIAAEMAHISVFMNFTHDIVIAKVGHSTWFFGKVSQLLYKFKSAPRWNSRVVQSHLQIHCRKLFMRKIIIWGVGKNMLICLLVLDRITEFKVISNSQRKSFIQQRGHNVQKWHFQYNCFK